MMRRDFLPDNISQHLLVEVYLPKNLLNYGELIRLLTEILEFDCARNRLIKNCKKMWETDGIWKKHDPKMNYKEFEQQVKDIKKTIFGFSIYEVDGAFEYDAGDKKGKEIRVKVFTVEENRREGFICALEAKSIDAIKPVFEDNRQTLGNSGNLKIVKNDEKHWEIRDGNNLYKIVDTDTQLDVYRYIHLLEERTLVIRFITDLKIGPDPFILARDPGAGCPASNRRIAVVLPPTVFKDSDSGDGDGEMDKARKTIWDTMMLIGGYFVRNLGSRVGIEDEIWITYNFGFLWIWEGGTPQAGRQLIE